MHGRENSAYAWLDACLLFLTKSFACRLSKPDSRIFLALEPQHVRKATTFKDGPLTRMEKLVSLRAKPLLVGAPSSILLMEGCISCLARSSQPKHISRMQGPGTIPTTLLNSRVSLRFPSVARLPVIPKRVSSTIPGMRLAFAWALSNHAGTSPCGSPASVSCWKSNEGMQHIYTHAQNLRNECANHAAALGTYGSDFKS